MHIDHKVCTIPSGLHRFLEPFEYVPPARYEAALRLIDNLLTENEHLKQKAKTINRKESEGQDGRKA